jgi:hypothetical protein
MVGGVITHTIGQRLTIFVAVATVHSIGLCGILFVAILWSLAGLAGMICADVKTVSPAVVLVEELADWLRVVIVVIVASAVAVVVIH